jgi:hypothetical protein
MTNEELLARMREVSAGGNDAELEAFLAEVDALDAARDARLNAPEALAQAALWYVSIGVPVFPLRPRSKTPLIRSPHPDGSPQRASCYGECGRDGHGLHDAVTDLVKVRAWWTETPTANIGLPTGIVFDVIDIDGPPGFASLLDLRDEGALPGVLGTVWTPGDPDKTKFPNAPGRHLYIAPTGDGNSTAILPGVDYRGLGGYVAAPPSVGKNGRRYDWMCPLNTTALVKAA